MEQLAAILAELVAFIYDWLRPDRDKENCNSQDQTHRDEEE